SRYELLITTNAELMEITGLSEIALLEIKQKLGEDYFPRQQCILFKKKTTAKVYKTGIENFDILTAKIPLQTGSIWEICGKSSAGKTQLCHTMALNFVAQSHGTVLYIDTKGKLTAGTNSDLSNLKLVVIDALAAVFFTHRTETEHLRGKYLLTTLNNLVYKLSKEHHIAFIYVNLIVNIEEETLAAEDEEYEEHIEEVTASPSHGCGKGMRPALGEYWSRAPRLRLSIGIPPDSSAMTNERTLRIIKSCYTAAGGMCSLRITSAGVL
ncbi:PREDICTED: DNA repair protein RAD51 homolog 4-like, partial [Rhagoletis zephyria]|uniref:DNA repair protein RAD51 homolog 4-like n=1 Tax=Rhagoletis zephyria TaxID=28612 RepID=UPI0008115109